MKIETIIQSIKQILKSDLRPIEQKDKTCPFFQKGNCTVAGWISCSQETENFCEKEFKACQFYIKQKLEKRLKERFFIHNLKKQCMARLKNFVISGADIFLEEALEDLFIEYELKQSVSEKRIEEIMDYLMGAKDEKKDEKEERPRVSAEQRTKYARHVAKRRIDLNADTKLLSGC